MHQFFKTILVVDDDEELLRVNAQHGVDLGRDVLTAKSGAAGVRLARETVPDLVTLDLSMPGERIEEVLRDFRELLPTTPIVIVSGRLSVTIADELRTLGASKVVCKPITLPELLYQMEIGDAPRALSKEYTPTLARAEYEHMMRVLHDCMGNKSLAAERLGLHRQALQERLRKKPPQ